MSAVVVHKSSQPVASRSNSPSKKWVGHGRSTTRTDLVAYPTELVVISWDVVRSRRRTSVYSLL